MRIAVLADALRAAGGLSVGKNMIAAMGRVAPEHTYLLTLPAGVGYEPIIEHVPRCEAVFRHDRGKRVRLWLYRTFEEPRLVKRFGPDVILSLGNRGLLDPPCPQAILVQDAHHFYPSEQYGQETPMLRLIWRYHAQHLRKTLRRAQLVLCQTAVAERRLRQTHDYKGRTAICPNAVSTALLARPANASPPPALVPFDGFTKLLCLTRYYAHKNLESIVDTFSRFKEELSEVVVVLTIAPDQHPRAARLLRAIAKRDLTDRIINVGPLSQEVLASYYANCDALLLPTLLESFTGTYLEAMHFGLPILTSDLDFAHGLCGAAALYFDPRDPRSMKRAILRIKDDFETRQQLRQQGRARLGSMLNDWDDIANHVICLLKQL
ncbi:MAG TPA: glycosyltransferase [Phycisphaerae bacterium]|nr:glycosyltransferase [Phycisphaerae bacterium]